MYTNSNESKVLINKYFLP